MSTESPYQPPKTEIGEPASSPPRLERPASTKWVLFFATLFVGMLIWVYIENGSSIEWWKWQLAQPWRIALQFFILFSFVILCSSHPRKLAYACGVIHCIGFAAIMAFSSIQRLVIKPTLWATNEDRADLVVTPLLIGLMIWLFYRFTFGLPSRRYYGIGAAKNKTE